MPQVGDQRRGLDGRLFTFKGGENVRENWEAQETLTDFPDPPGASNPYKRVSPKAAERLYQGQLTAFDKGQDAAAEEAGKARVRMGQFDRFKQLNTVKDTGGVLGWPGIGWALKTVRKPFDPQLSEMDSITAAVAPAMRAPGSGSSSDYDVKMFERATVGVDKPKETNDAIIAAAKVAQQNVLDRVSFNDAYFAKFGTNIGIERAWQDYLNKNPIFDTTSPDKPILNKKRQTWDKYIGAIGGPKKVGRFIVEEH